MAKEASRNKCLTSSNKKLLGTSATLVVTGALLVTNAHRAILQPNSVYFSFTKHVETADLVMDNTFTRLPDASSTLKTEIIAMASNLLATITVKKNPSDPSLSKYRMNSPKQVQGAIPGSIRWDHRPRVAEPRLTKRYSGPLVPKGAPFEKKKPSNGQLKSSPT